MTGVPDAYDAEHETPQKIPEGVLTTVPEPAPANETDSRKVETEISKFAVTTFAELMVTEHAPVPEQAPLQPVNADPAAAVAARLTTAPELNEAPQVAPQLMPAGEDVTVPVPVPVLDTVSV